MAMYVEVGGEMVIVDDRLWSLDAQTMAPFAPDAYVGSSLLHPTVVWRKQRSVRMVVGFLARNVAQVPLLSYTLDADGDAIPIPADRALPKLQVRPNPTNTRYRFIYNLVTDICLWDRYCAVITGERASLKMTRLPPERWRFKRDYLNQPTAIMTWDENGHADELSLDDCFWMDGYPVPGCTPIEALCDLLREEREAAQYRREIWRNQGRFGGWIERPLESPEWTKTARTNFKSSFEGFSSGGDRAGNTPIMEDGMKYHELTNGITPETAQQLETRKFSIAEVAASFYLPPVFVGILDNANYSNVNAFREVLYSDTLGPWFTDIQQAFDHCVLPNPRVWGTTGAFSEFSVNDKLRMSFAQEIQTLRAATGVPFVTADEARSRVRLRKRGGNADELIVPLNVGYGDDGASPTAEPDNTTPGEPSPEPGANQ